MLTNSGTGQSLLHPEWSSCFGIYMFNNPAQVTWTASSVHNHFLFIGNSGCNVCNFRCSNCQLVNYSNFTGNTANAEAVTTVRCNTDINDMIVKIKIFTDVHTNRCIIWQLKQSIKFIFKINFRGTTEHSLRFNTTKFAFFNFEITRQNCPNCCDCCFHTCTHIRCTAYNL